MQTQPVRILVAVFALLTVAMIAHFFWPSAGTIQADSGKFAFLEPQAGNTEGGGKEFIDMRTGDDYACDYKTCRLAGRFAFDTIK